MSNTRFSLSIVSHGHEKYITRIIEDLLHLNRLDIEVIITFNLPENLPFNIATLPFSVKVINNAAPKGFAANHNAAFTLSQGDNFVILNPDIKLIDDPFDILLSLVESNSNCICAPLIISKTGKVEDSARNFPSPNILLKKLIYKLFKHPMTRDVVPENSNVLLPDWVAGMFVVVPRSVYEKLHGLSERYFLYYEDVDFCARARLAGCEIMVTKHARVIHEAQRDSHHKVRYLVWHLKSALKFFTSRTYLKIRLNRLLRI
jgi:N-acetylglucosaminyl-diphospho-decaprenol L-rhamnosyltransferase